MTSDLYARLVTTLAHLRDLESQGCHAIGAHAHADGIVIEIDPPPPAIVETWSWAYAAPPPGQCQAPVCCRHPRSDRVIVQWHPLRRPAPQPVPPLTPGRRPRRADRPEAA